MVVNPFDHGVRGRVQLAWPELDGRELRLEDALDGQVFERAGSDIANPGLSPDLPSLGIHPLRFCLAAESSRARTDPESTTVFGEVRAALW